MMDHDSKERSCGREADDDEWLVEMAQAGEDRGCGRCGDGDKQTQKVKRQGFRLEEEGIWLRMMATLNPLQLRC